MHLLLSQIALQLCMTSYLDAYCRDFGQAILFKLERCPLAPQLLLAVENPTRAHELHAR